MAQADLTRVASNIGALNSLWALQGINRQLGVHQTRLSTGKRINSAADDPAGLTIATKLKSRSEGLNVAIGNIGDAKNLLAVAEGGIGRITDIIISMKNKAAQAASDTMGTAERAAIKEQLTAYANQIDDIVEQTSWNGNKLIDGQYNTGKTLQFQTGADASDTTEVNGLINLRATTGGFTDDLAIASITGAASASVSSVGNSMLLTGSVLTGAADNANIDNLASGAYTVRLTTRVGATDTIELLDASGNPKLISTTAAGTGNVALSATLDLNAATAYDFGNGLVVQWAVAKGDTATSGQATVNYTGADGNYEMTSLGGIAVGDTWNTTINGTPTTLTATVLGDADSYSDLMTYLESKLDTVNTMMSKVGAFTGRLTFKEDQVMASQINVEASYNRIMNANMAEEQVNASKFLILQQTSIAMLGQANQAPQFLLSLFR